MKENVCRGARQERRGPGSGRSPRWDRPLNFLSDRRRDGIVNRRCDEYFFIAHLPLEFHFGETSISFYPRLIVWVESLLHMFTSKMSTQICISNIDRNFQLAILYKFPGRIFVHILNSTFCTNVQLEFLYNFSAHISVTMFTQNWCTNSLKFLYKFSSDSCTSLVTISVQI